MLKSKSWFKSIRSVFRWSDADEKIVMIHLARLCVLYEDIQIESAGAQAEKIAELDRTDRETRRFYFVRRTLATLTEIEQALHVLNGNGAFKRRKDVWPKEPVKAWDEAVKFFSGNHAFLKDWRNDAGGHFLQTSAEYALENMDEKVVGAMDFYRRGNGADVKMPFAYEFVAAALTKNNRDPGKTELQFAQEAFTFLAEAVTHAMNAIQIVVLLEIQPRFKG
jgi:hypothetical protein